MFESKHAATIRREAVARLTQRWSRLRPHPEQSRVWRSPARIKLLGCGRRSGKSELLKRNRLLQAFGNTRHFADYPHWTVFAGPTGPQMKNLYWLEITENMLPSEFVVDANASTMTATLWNGAQISVMSLEKGPRLEGRPIDALGVDEFHEVKPRIWQENLRPAMSTEARYGDAWLVGIPRGGRAGHFHAMMVDCRKPSNPDMDYFHWTSASVLGATASGREELEAAQRTLDPRTYAQEYEANFQNFAGRAYFTFDYGVHAANELRYDPRDDLVFCFDFNRSPGTASVVQEQDILRTYGRRFRGIDEVASACIGEVWIPVDSNTRRVCDVLTHRYGKAGLDHQGLVHLHGDATGGVKGHTVPFDGTDWTEIQALMEAAFPGRVRSHVRRSNPRERVRVNALNARLQSADGARRFVACPTNAPHVCDDLDSVLVLDGTMGELDKASNPLLTHLSDGLGYYVAEAFPLSGPGMEITYGR